MMYEEYVNGIGETKTTNDEYRKAEAVYLMLPYAFGHETVFAIRKALGSEDAIKLFDFIINLDSERIRAEESVDALKRQIQNALEDEHEAEETISKLLKMINAVNSKLDKPVQEMYADIIAEQTKNDTLADWENLTAIFGDY